MVTPKQLPLIGDFAIPSMATANNAPSINDLGTFKDNLRTPIHRWFKYPAGYSYKFVDMYFNKYGMSSNDWVYDPFCGTGTTLLCAKQRGINAYGVEAHSFVHWVSSVKLYWEYDFSTLEHRITELITQSRAFVKKFGESAKTEGIFPELVHKCYHPEDLDVLYALREFITHEILEQDISNLFKLALTDTLRNAAAAGTGWPYISPRKNTGTKPPKNALDIFCKIVLNMFSDLETVSGYAKTSEIRNILGDSREKQDMLDNQVKLALTSPPYLNNYDYADRTRLETYFWGLASSWREITDKYRSKLITAATTQVKRSKHQVDTILNEDIKLSAPSVYNTVQEAVLSLAELRPQKGGKKDYDLMVALYFNDLYEIIKETHRVLEDDGHFVLVLGDSAPYGVHIATDELIGHLAVAIGFKSFEYTELRRRGGKWKDNPQRHKVKLREGIIELTK